GNRSDVAQDVQSLVPTCPRIEDDEDRLATGDPAENVLPAGRHDGAHVVIAEIVHERPSRIQVVVDDQDVSHAVTHHVAPSANIPRSGLLLPWAKLSGDPAPCWLVSIGVGSMMASGATAVGPAWPGRSIGPEASARDSMAVFHCAVGPMSLRSGARKGSVVTSRGPGRHQWCEP